MNKIFYLLFVLMSISVISNAQVTVLSENFEHAGSLPTGWTQEYVSSSVSWICGTGGYSSNPAAAHGGTYNARFYSGNYNGDRTRFITPAMNLSGMINCQLSFWHAQVDWAGDLDTLRVYYKTSAGGSWTLLASYGAEAATWTLRTITLPSVSSTYYIAFDGHSGYGYGICVDDVTVTGVVPTGPDTILVNSTNNNLTFNTCNAVVYDNGGPTGDYTNNNNYVVTIASTNGSCVRAIIEFYNIEYNYDFLYFYDGPNTTYPQIGERLDAYPGYPYTTLNSNGNAYYALSGYLTIKFTSDGATIAPGFKIRVECPENCVAPTCVGSEPAGEFCNTPATICDLTGYCGNTSTSYPTDHDEIDSYNLKIFCGGINNNSWLKFVADSTAAILDVWVKNCQGSPMYDGTPILGIQLQVFETDCSYGNFTPVSNCWSPSEQINGQIVATGLTPGNPYLIMIDGYAKDNCEYTFAASAGVSVASAGLDKTICEGEYVTLNASGGTNVLWSSSPSDPSLNGQTGNLSISVSPGQTTTYTAQVWGSNPYCSSPADVTVFVNSADASFTGLDDAYCSNSSSVTLSGNYTSGVFSGNGVSGSTFNPSSVSSGNQNITYTYNYSVVTAFFDDFDPSPNAGWTSGWSSLGSTGTQGNSWATGKPKGGRGNSTNGSADPLIDHSSNVDNNVYGQGLSASSGDGVGGNFDNSQEWLRTPAINCAGLSNTTLSFWRYCNLENTWDEGYVMISTNGTTWYGLGEPLYPADDHWVQRIIDISQYADNQSTVYIRWESQADGSTTWSGWNIDDVSVTGVQSGGSCVSTDIQTTYINPSITATIAKTDVSCYGQTNGTATVTPSGGTAPYTYLWSNGQTSQTATGLSAGTYYVTVNDIYGVCQSAVKSITISQPSQITLTTSYTNSSCGQSNGSASVVASNGYTPYTYLWNTGATTSSITSKPAGTYYVTVTDSHSCSNNTSVNINDAGAPTASVTSYTSVTCNGASTGAINITVSSGTAPYTYLWSSGQTSEDLSGIAAGTYTITVTDASNCKANAAVTITQPTAITLTNTKTDVKCYGASTGAIDLTVSGGTPGYSYHWSNNATTQDLSGISAGTYSITVTDANSCTSITSVTVSQPSAALTATITSSNPLCNGGTGSATVNVTGGTASYIYVWSNFQTSATISNITAGTYIVSVQDANSCTTTASVTLTQPTAITVTNSVTDVQCYGQSNGAVNISVTGGTPNYSYLWSNGAGSEDISNVAAGNYNITITDANNCKAYSGLTVNQPEQLTSTTSVTNVLCNNGNTGQIALTVSGGTPAFSYQWSNGNATQNISNVSAGVYSVTITDNHLCSTTATATISQPTALVLNTSSTNSSCGSSNGTASVSVSGGTPSYTYYWSTGATTTSISNIASGAYNVTVTDSNNCTQTSSVNVNDDNAAIVSITSSTNVSCYGGTNGSATVAVTSGGTAPFTYNWTNGSNQQTAASLAGGIHSVTVTDNNGCVSTASVTITQPTDLVISVTKTDVTCYGVNDGKIDISVSGGTPVYSYNWSNGSSSQNQINLAPGSYTVTVTDANGCIKNNSATITQPSAINISNSSQNASCFGKNDGFSDISVTGGTVPYTYLWSNGQITEDISNLVAGNYTGTVTDANNCKATVSISISQPSAISYNITKTNVSCYGYNDGTIDLSVSGGTTPYNYLWSNGQMTQDISDLPSGTYTVVITDANLCDATTSVSISEPSQITTSITGTNVTCNGLSNGSINLTVSGGSIPYTYAWNYGQTSQDLFNITGGNYEVTITDHNNCYAIVSYIITEPEAIVLSCTTTNVSCYEGSDGSIDLSVNGGVSPFAYLWTNGSTSGDISDLTSGTYTVTVTDVNNCEKIVSAPISQPTRLAAVIIGYNIDCYGNKNGRAVLTIVGGTPNYVYAWSNGNTSDDMYGLEPGTYNVTIVDSKGCSVVDSVEISQPSAPLAVDIPKYSNVVCYKATNGYAQSLVTGGTIPYSYSWSVTNHTDSVLNNIGGGMYYLTVTDVNSCAAIDSVVVKEAEQIEWTYVSNATSCKGSSDGSIQITAAGTGKPYTFTWNTEPQKTDTLISELPYGLYEVTITDKYGCTALDTIAVLNADNTCLEIPTCFTPNGDQVNDTWEIKHVELYPDIHVEVYNRWGILLFTSDGYLEQWDGMYNGKELPMGSFVFIIDLGDGSDIINGTVSIIR